MTGSLDPEQARELLARAEGAESVARAGASWPAVVSLMSLGPASSLALVGLWLAPSSLTWLPMVFMLVWIGLGLAFGRAFPGPVKRGFGGRWLTTMAIWGALWVAAIVLASLPLGDNVVFVTFAAAALSLVCAGGAWLEASR